MIAGVLVSCASGGGREAADAFDADPGPEAGVLVPSRLDEYGGFLDRTIGTSDGRFRVVEHGGRWWLKTPSGHAFMAFATAGVSFTGDTDPALGYAPVEHANRAWYGDDEAGRVAFHNEATTRLSRVGFNTLGSGSDEAAVLVARRQVGPVPYVIAVPFFAAVTAGNAGVPTVNPDGFPDVFHPEFADRCGQAALDALPAVVRTDPYLVGVFADSGIRWWGEGRDGPAPGASLADSFIALAPGSPGKDAFVGFLFDDLGYTLETLGAAWGRSFSTPDDVAALLELPDDPAHPAVARDKAAFVGHVARTYVQAVGAAVGAVAPGALFLCAPFEGSAPEEVLGAASACDVVSVREQDPLDDAASVARFGEAVADRWRRVAREAGQGGGPKPLWLVVPGVHARDSGLADPGAGIAVEDRQADRGRWVREVLERAVAAEDDGTGLVVGVEVGTFADGPRVHTGLLAVHGSPYLTFEAGVREALVLACDRLLGGTARVLAAPANLRVAAGLRLEWDPVPGATSYEVLLAQDPAFRGVVARSDWGGATVDGPHDLRWTVTTPGALVDRPLSAGPWFATVSARAEGRAIASDFAAPVTFTAPRACPPEHGTEAVVGCFERSGASVGTAGSVSVSTLFFDALGVVVPDAVFLLPGGSGDAKTAPEEVVLVREYPEPVEGSAAGDRFCPAPVVTPDGQRMNAARFVRVRHVTPLGQVVVDRPLDPDGGVAPFSCAGPVPSTGEPIARKVYSLDLSNPLLPRDQRIEVQLH